MKQNEEYRFFKGRKKSSIPNMDYFKSDTPDNVKDPNEPFLNKNKPEYLKIKRTKEILNLLGIPASVWFSFISSLKYIFPNMRDTLVSENGKTLKIDNDAEYYFIELNLNSDNDNRIYIFPNKKKIVVRCYIHPTGYVKNVFSYPNDENKITLHHATSTAYETGVRKVLDDIYEYLKNLVGSPFDNKMKREKELSKIRQSRHDRLLDPDVISPDGGNEEPSKPKSHDNGVNLNADDTATFDNLNHVKSFKNYIRS